MFKLGEYQNLLIFRKTDFGYYLKEPDSDIDIDIFLPTRELNEDSQIGDIINVFVYRDSEDRLICTTTKPKLELGKLGLLKVSKIDEIGAFLDWGLRKDLLLPFSEQLDPVEEGDIVLVRLYIDKTERLCATMKITRDITDASAYKIDEMLPGTIYRINPDIGLFIAVEDLYDGLVPNKDVFDHYNVGDSVTVRIARIRDDNKLILTLKKRANLQISDDSALILEKLKLNNGFLKFNDKSDPDEIKKEFNMSKKAFKRAVGTLLKEKTIEFFEDGIKLI